MIIQLAIGSVIIVFNVILQAEMFSAFGKRLERVIRAYPVNAYTYYMLGAANHPSRVR